MTVTTPTIPATDRVRGTTPTIPATDEARATTPELRRLGSINHRLVLLLGASVVAVAVALSLLLGH